MDFTHKQLVNVARKWLTRKCAVVVTELTSGGEYADALGFQHNGQSMLVECKSSRADFRADTRKYFRHTPEMGMGAERYYLTAKGLLSVAELPEGWGLLEWDGRRVSEAKASCYFEGRNHNRERSTLISLLRRLYIPGRDGVSIKCYQFDLYSSKCKATLGIQRDGATAAEPNATAPLAPR